MIGTSSDWLGWDDIKYLDSCSNISIEAHTVTHPYLNRLSDQTLRDELAFSKDTLESLLGHAILGMAYPYGAYDSRVLSMARGVGYCAAYTTKCGPVQASAYSLETPRALVNSADSLSTLCRKLRGCYDWI
jgi:peptidoglycan/xylan/chitin deacetylase (PgdA/CDA1 family)